MAPGTLLADRYEIGVSIGNGGFGITYKAWDHTLAKVVAVKEYYPAGMVNRVPGEKDMIIYSGNRGKECNNGKLRFLEEARNMARFNTHPNIINVYDFFEENNTAYIIMEFELSQLVPIAEKEGLVIIGDSDTPLYASDQSIEETAVRSIREQVRNFHRFGYKGE